MNHAIDGTRAPSINARLTRTALTTVIVGALLGAAAATFAVRGQVRHLMDSALEETAQALVGLAYEEHELLEIARGRSLPAPPHDERLQWQLRSANGTLIVRSHEAPDTPWPAPLAEGHTRIPGMAVYTMTGHGVWVHVAQPLDHLREAQFEAALQTAGAVLGCGMLAALWLGLRVRRELQPVAQLAHDVDAMEPASPAGAPPRSPRRELEPVYTALTDLQHRLAERIAAEQAFSEHAAHSLRTPLAGLAAQLEVACASAPAEVQHRLTLALDAARRLNGVITALLAMGRAVGAASPRRFAPAELAGVLAGRQIEIDTSALASAAAITGDIDLLSVALANLVDNAARHGARRAVVSAATAADTHTLSVVDDGPGVPQEQLARLRAALARGGGAELGLGLALAAAVARSHGGALSIESPPAGRANGFAARLAWRSSRPTQNDGAAIGRASA